MAPIFGCWKGDAKIEFGSDSGHGPHTHSFLKYCNYADECNIPCHNDVHDKLITEQRPNSWT